MMSENERGLVYTFKIPGDMTQQSFGFSKPIRRNRRIRLQQAWDSVLVCAVYTFGISLSVIGFALTLWLAHWITR